VAANSGNGGIGTFFCQPSIVFAPLIAFFIRSSKPSLTFVMAADFIGCWLVEILCKALFADLAPKTADHERPGATRAQKAGGGADEV
jgi:hypothetical protein